MSSNKEDHTLVKNYVSLKDKLHRSCRKKIKKELELAKSVEPANKRKGMIQLTGFQGATDRELRLLRWMWSLLVTDVVLSQEGEPQRYQSIRETSRNRQLLVGHIIHDLSRATHPEGNNLLILLLMYSR